MADRHKKIRVLHLPEAVGGNSPGLAAAEREVGLDSSALTLRPHPFGYEGVEPVCGDKASAPALLLGMCRLFFTAVTRADVLHFNFGRSIFDPGPNVAGRLPWWTGGRRLLEWLQVAELWLYRLAGKAVFVTYMGDDARQGDESRSRFAITMANHVGEDYYTAASDAIKRRRIRVFDRFAAEVFFLNPDLGWVLPQRAKFMAYASVDPREWQPCYPQPDANDGPHLVHAPSHRGAKGSDLILQAVEKLNAEGLIFRFTLVEGRTREQAREIYREADLVIDQLLAGWYGGFASECMALGKPVVAYLREEDLHFIPDGMRAELPLIQATPETIYDVLKDWITSDGSRFEDQGKKGRRYVERWHDPLKVAGHLKDCYEQALAAR